jgi:hypothetical protein
MVREGAKEKLFIPNHNESPESTFHLLIQWPSGLESIFQIAFWSFLKHL